MHPTPTVSLYLAGGCLLAGLSMQAMAAPGEDTIYLNRPVQYLSLPSGGTAKSTDIQNKTDIPDVSGYATKVYVDNGLSEKVDTSTYTTEQAAQDEEFAPAGLVHEPEKGRP